ncbi:hypothetical protein [Haloarcula laminariae]|uniref:hypothetical protein n=1 Tax=Haloarcula laminariae TaxID=2961577 RepID=UPI0021C79E53|nr:hypothetical protein [Halomicroarcula laminariae]
MTEQTPTWPEREPSYRLRPPATDLSAGLDGLAAALDATPRQPETATVKLRIGRQTDVIGPRREALEALSGYPDVTVDAGTTAGTVPLTGETFDALAELFEDVERALVRDADGVAVAEWRDERLRFALPSDAVSRVRAAVDAERIEQVE